MSWGGGIGLPREASLRPLQLSAPRLLLASFAGLIAFGTAGLTLLPGRQMQRVVFVEPVRERPLARSGQAVLIVPGWHTSARHLW